MKLNKYGHYILTKLNSSLNLTQTPSQIDKLIPLKFLLILTLTPYQQASLSYSETRMKLKTKGHFSYIFLPHMPYAYSSWDYPKETDSAAKAEGFTTQTARYQSPKHHCK